MKAACCRVATELRRSLLVLLDFIYPRACSLCDRELWIWQEGPGAFRYLCADCGRRLATIEAPICGVCGRPLGSGRGDDLRCQACRRRRPALGICWMRSGFYLKGGARELLHRFKYDGATWLAGDLADLMGRCISMAEPAVRSRWDLLVPVPLHPRRQRKRGFNQAELLARGLAREWGMELATGVVRRHQSTETQALLSAAGRRLNVQRAFSVRSSKAIAGKRVLLVDDVTTTGATLTAVARVLQRLPEAERPRRIGAITFARGGF